MPFLHVALGIAGLLCVAVPVLIHFLIRRRRPPVRFGAMRLLLIALQQNKIRREQLLLLLLRCLLVAFLGAAIGRPILDAAGLLGGQAGREVYILVDNSIAASVLESDGTTALDTHRARAYEMLQDLREGIDMVSIVSLASPAAEVVEPTSSIRSARAALAQLGTTDSAADIRQGVRLVADRMETAPAGEGVDTNRSVVVLSDFSAGAAPVGEAFAAGHLKGLGAELIASTPRSDGPSNVQVVSVKTLRSVALVGDAAGEEQVLVGLRRTGDAAPGGQETVVRVRLVGDESAASVVQATYTWKPNQTESDPVKVRFDAAAAVQMLPENVSPDRSSGVAVVEVSIGTDAIVSDNTLWHPVVVRRSIRVGLVAPSSTYGQDWTTDRFLRAALSSSGGMVDVDVLSPSSLTPETLGTLDAVLLPRPEMFTGDAPAWRRLRAFVDRGGALLLFPPSETSVHQWTDDFVSSMGVPWIFDREMEVSQEWRGMAPTQPVTNLTRMLSSEIGGLLDALAVRSTLLYTSRSGRPVGDPVLVLQGGAPWITSVRPGGESTNGRGLIVYVASPLENGASTLQVSSLMVPLLLEVCRQGVGEAYGDMQHTAGSLPRLTGAGVEVRPWAKTGSFVSDADSEGALRDAPDEALVLEVVNGFGATVGLLAVNADAAGAVTDTQGQDLVAGWIAGAGVNVDGIRWVSSGGSAAASAGAGVDEASTAGGIFESRHESDSLSMWLFVASLLVGLTEVVFARVFSHAVRRNDPSPRGRFGRASQGVGAAA